MPKKTKKQKKLAESRRTFVPVQTAATTTADKHPHPQSETVLKFQMPHTPVVKITDDDMAELKIVRSDLVKTFLFSVFAFAVEISAYWMLRK